MKPIDVKRKLSAAIDGVANNSHDYCVNAQSDFKRNRKLPFIRMLQGIIGMGGSSLTNELLDMSAYSPESASTSAFVQQRVKIKPEAFETVFRSFSNNLSCDFTEDIRVLAIDGSAMQTATNPNDADSFFPGTNGQKPYNFLHLNALYDLKHHIYIDAVIQKAKLRNEHKSFIETVLTNLDRQIYPPQKLKELYAGRWGIETSFRD